MKKSPFTKTIFFAFIIAVALSAVICCNAPAHGNIVNAEALARSEDSIASPEATRVIALLLDPYIRAAIDNYFGEPTQYASYNATINEITQVGNDFAYKVIISVQTFHGAHNPPYGMETMTFTIRSGGRVVLDNYVHQNI